MPLALAITMSHAFSPGPSLAVGQVASCFSRPGDEFLLHDMGLDPEFMDAQPAKVLKKEAFYDPAQLVPALDSIRAVDGDKLLQGVLNRLDGLAKSPDLVLLILEASAEVDLALKLCARLADALPRAERLLWDWGGVLSPGQNDQAAASGVRVLSGHDGDLSSWLNRDIPRAMMTDYRKLDLRAYFSPSPVLAFETGSDWGACLEQAHELGALGLVMGPDPATPAYLEELGRQFRGETPAIAVCCRLDEFEAGFDWQALAQSGLALIEWSGPGHGGKKQVAALLRGAAKAGIWNHLRLEQAHGVDEFALKNPNLVHSCQSGRDGLQASGDNGLPAFPGRALWRHLRLPQHLLLYSARYGARRVSRWRVGPGKGQHWEVGQGLEYHYQAPDEIAPKLFEHICRLVESGGAVAVGWVRHNLRRAYVIAYAMEQGALVGVSSLKHPREEFIARLKKLTGLDLSGYVERGYTSVRPQYRGLGIGTKLLEGETAIARQRGRRLYAILSEDNIGAQQMAIRNNTVKTVTFYSDKAGKDMAVWLPQWVLEMDKPKGAA